MLTVQNASFSRNAHGHVCIALDDPAFARADVVFIDPSSRLISGLLGDLHFRIGIVDESMVETFLKNHSVILTAPHPQGHQLALMAPVLTIQ